MKHLKFLFLAVVAVLGFAACTPGEFEAKQYVYFWVKGAEGTEVVANTQQGELTVVIDEDGYAMVDFCEGKKVEGQNWLDFADQNYGVAKADRCLKVGEKEVANANVATSWVKGKKVDPARFGSKDEGTQDFVLVLKK